MGMLSHRILLDRCDIIYRTPNVTHAIYSMPRITQHIASEDVRWCGMLQISRVLYCLQHEGLTLLSA